MKKHFRFILALALIAALTVSAVAYSDTMDGAGSGVVDIEVEYQAPTDNRADIENGDESTRVYSVVLEWQSVGKIVYNAGKTTYSWNNSKLQYDSEVVNKGWTVDNAKIIITARNRSNRPVELSCADPVSIGEVELTGSYDRKSVIVSSAATGGFDGVGTEQSGTIVYTVEDVSGDISSNVDNIASITITVKGK